MFTAIQTKLVSRYDLGNKSDVFLELSYIMNVSTVQIYIGSAMAYPTQSSVSEKLKKKNLESHTPSSHDEINFDWCGIEFNIKKNLYFSIYNTGYLHGKFKTIKLMICLDSNIELWYTVVM